MKLGLNLVMVRPDHMPGIAARAEELGYESVFVPDHLVFPAHVASKYPYMPDGSFPFPLDTPLFDPWLVLMQIAQETSTIRLGTAVYVLPLRHPFITARAVTTLDVLSGGRAILGVGAGWLAEEFTVLGLDPTTRFSRTEESMDVIRALWTQRETSFGGKHFQFDSVYFEPKPVSSPHPPILLGGESDGAIARAVRSADGWISAGTATDVAAIENRVAKITALREQHGASRPFEVSVLYPRPSREDIERLAAAGVDRVIAMPWNRGREAVAGLEALAADAMSASG
jgi:probable F420-dependent oxidoreductase